jgi:hypothetical protein
MVPVAISAAESLEELRHWASGRCLDAHHGGRYCQPASTNKRRGIRLGASEN